MRYMYLGNIFIFKLTYTVKIYESLFNNKKKCKL